VCVSKGEPPRRRAQQHPRAELTAVREGHLLRTDPPDHVEVGQATGAWRRTTAQKALLLSRACSCPAPVARLPDLGPPGDVTTSQAGSPTVVARPRLQTWGEVVCRTDCGDATVTSALTNRDNPTGVTGHQDRHRQPQTAARYRAGAEPVCNTKTVLTRQ
jgi:hypothetical protein